MAKKIIVSYRLLGWMFFLLCGSTHARDKDPVQKFENLIHLEQLTQMEKKLKQEKQELSDLKDKLRKQYEDLVEKEKKILSFLEDIQKQHEEGLKKVQNWLNLMNPENTASILNGLPIELVVLILDQLPEKKTAIILEQLQTTVAQEVLKRKTKLEAKNYLELLSYLGFCTLPKSSPNTDSPSNQVSNGKNSQ